MVLTLISTGSNAGGQLGHSFPHDTHVFRACHDASSLLSVFPPRGTEHVLDLALGANHTVALLSIRDATGQLTNEVWGTGSSDQGQLGLPVPTLIPSQGFRKLNLPTYSCSDASVDLGRYKPTLIASSFNTTFIAFTVLSCSSVSAPNSAPRALLLAMGSNDVSVLGNGTDSSACGSHAWHIFPDEDIQMISSSPRSVVLVLVDRRSGMRTQRVLGWGGARQGQLGPISRPANAPVTPSSKISKGRHRVKSALSSDNLLSNTVDHPTPLCLPTQLEIQAVSSGMSHTIYLTASDRSELVFQGGPTLQPPPSISMLGRVKQVQSTWSAIFILVDRPSPITSESIEARPCSEIHGWGQSRNGQLGPASEMSTIIVFPPSSPPVESLYAGSAHLLSLHRSSQTGRAEIWGWGWNEHGNLGDGHTEDRPTPILVWPASSSGFSYDQSIKSDQSIKDDQSNLKEGQEAKWKFDGDGQVERCWAGNGTSWVLLRSLSERSSKGTFLTTIET